MSGGDGRRPPTGRWTPPGAPEPRRGGAWRCGLIHHRRNSRVRLFVTKRSSASAGPVSKCRSLSPREGHTTEAAEEGEGSARARRISPGWFSRTGRPSHLAGVELRSRSPARSPPVQTRSATAERRFHRHGRGRRRLVEGVRRRRGRRSRRLRRRVRASGPTRPRRRRRRALPGVRRTRVRRRAPPEAQGSPREPRRREHLAHALHGCREGGQRRGRRERVVVGRRGRAEGRRGARRGGGRAKETSRAARGSHAPLE